MIIFTDIKYYHVFSAVLLVRKVPKKSLQLIQTLMMIVIMMIIRKILLQNHQLRN
jgi:hypothetical protein